jgi:hypothetical protein
VIDDIIFYGHKQLWRRGMQTIRVMSFLHSFSAGITNIARPCEVKDKDNSGIISLFLLEIRF